MHGCGRVGDAAPRGWGMESVHRFLNAVNGVLWHDAVLFVVLGVGVLFTLWSRGGQLRALTHGVALLSCRYDRPGDPGAISHDYFRRRREGRGRSAR